MTETSQTAHRWRKKPVVIEAVQLTRENAAEVWHWASEAFRTGQARDVIIDADDGLTIRTLEGDMKANFGDWAIRGVGGEFYPCKDEIFRQTHEPADGYDEEFAADAASLDDVGYPRPAPADLPPDPSADELRLAAERDELEAKLRETAADNIALRNLLDDFTHAVIDLDDGARLVGIDRLAAAARSVREKAGLGEVK